MIGRVNKRAKFSGAMNRLLKVRSLGVNVKRMMYESEGESFQYIIIIYIFHENLCFSAKKYKY